MEPRNSKNVGGGLGEGRLDYSGHFNFPLFGAPYRISNIAFTC